ncbi:MAG TPA: hypothetical protein VNZ62_01165 [Capillimicrobium sp.]|nr:hypothetical protein [Capillimicrobium sp.]
MMRTALLSVVLVVAGLAGIVALSTTAGPPDGYWVFEQDGVRVDLPEHLRSEPSAGRDVLIKLGDGHGTGALVARVPRRGRTLERYVAFTVAGIRGGDDPGHVVDSEGTDVPGADDAHRLVVEYPDHGLRTTQVIAQAGSRFVTLSVTVRRDRPNGVVDTDEIVGSFEIE